MYIDNSLKPLIDQLIETKEINMNIADMLLDIYQYVDAIKPGNKDDVFKQFLDFFRISQHDKESLKIAEIYVKNNLQKLDENEFVSDPYAKLIKPIKIKENGYKLDYLTFAPYQLLPVDEIEVNNFPYEEIYKVGYFEKEFSYLALIKDNNVWMSLNPNEITTMRPFIKSAHGNVLVLGLGLGYISYMIANKNNVSKVTIIEKDPKIIDIFKKYILPNFENKNKITIIHDDAFRFLENYRTYDYIFADLWHNPEDGISMYLRLKNIETKYKISINYWLEESLKSMKRRCVITILQEYFEGFKEKDYLNAKNSNDQVINRIYSTIKNISLNTKEDLLNLLKQ